MVIIESTIAHGVFKEQVKDFSQAEFDNLTIGLGKGAASAMVIYLILKMFAIADADKWAVSESLLRLLVLGGTYRLCTHPGFSLHLCSQKRQRKTYTASGSLGVIGVILNRLNVSVIAYNWDIPASLKVLSKMVGVCINHRGCHNAYHSVPIYRKTYGYTA